ncbi:DUF4097 family beta strand repeat-containing protein [soil metagenome]
MPTFSTPTPIDLAIELPVGRIDVVAGDRSDTTVEVRPSNPAKDVDRRGADETQVEFDATDNRLTIKGPKPRFSLFGPTESVDVRVELPAHSRLTAELSMGGVRTTGTLGATRIKASMGAVDLDNTGDLWLRAGHGNVTVKNVAGDAQVTADHGRIRIASIEGGSALKASHGSVVVGETHGDLQANLSYGDLEITNAEGSVTAKTAYGSVDLLEVSTGDIQVESAYGDIRVGVRAGVPAWLDLSSKNGLIRNELDGDRAPAADEQTVAVRARTQASSITIHRAK